MLIGIDASHIDPNNMTGTQNYLFNILKYVSKEQVSHTFHVYTKHGLSKEFFADMVSNNSQFIHKPLESRFSWTQCALAKQSWLDKLDVLFCPWQTMPILHNPKTDIVSVIHGLEYKRFMFGPTLYTCLFSKKIIAVSNDTKSSIIKRFHIPEYKIRVIYEGVDTAFFSKKENVSDIRRKYNITTDYVFFVGTVVPRKNVERMFQAFSRLVHDVNKDMQFVLAGAMPDESKYLYDVVKNLGLEHRVLFLGKVPNEDLPYLISGATFMSYVSLSEGFGLPVLEAMSCGTPVLTSNVSALAEIVDSAAFVVNPLDVNSIYEGMVLLTKDKNLRASFIEKGSAHVKNFSWNKSAHSILKEIEEL